MQTLHAVIVTAALDGRGPSLASLGNTRIAGATLIERAAVSARAAGASVIRVGGDGIDPFGDFPEVDGVFVIPANAVVGAGALETLLQTTRRHPDTAALLVDRRPEAANRLVRVREGRVTSLVADGDAASTDVALLSRHALSMIGRVRSVRQAYGRLARFGVLYGADVASHLYAAVRSSADAACIESTFLPHSRGFVSEIRRLAQAMRCARGGDRSTRRAAVLA